jgi:hypothetical protein
MSVFSFIVLAIAGAIAGGIIASKLNKEYVETMEYTKKKMLEYYRDIDINVSLGEADFGNGIFYGSLIGLYIGIFICFSSYFVDKSISGITLGLSDVVLAALGAIAGFVVTDFWNIESRELGNEISNEIDKEKELKRKEAELEEQRKRKAAEEEKARQEIANKLKTMHSKIQNVEYKRNSESYYKIIIEAFELCESIPGETAKLVKELDTEKQKIHTEALNNALNGNSPLAISGFRLLSRFEPDNHEYRTAIERLTDTNKLIESAKSYGFDLTSGYASPLRELVGYDK